ncbi:MAG: hypothetical protein ACI9E1_001801 [Cryomorphaceae bacterium]|jgi:hypothetical protein
MGIPFESTQNFDASYFHTFAYDNVDGYIHYFRHAKLTESHNFRVYLWPTYGNTVVGIKGKANTAYKIVEANDLDFSNPDRDPVPLIGSCVGTLNGNTVTTTAAGEATVELNLGTSKKAVFIRGEVVP